MIKGDETKQKILDAGIKLWPNVTGRGVATYIGMKHPTVAWHFGKSDELRAAVAQYAVEIGNSRVIAQLIAVRHPAIRKMPDHVRQKHMNAAS